MGFSKKKWLEIYKLLENEYGEVVCFLNHETPFQLLIAVMLSAQCTDVRVNMVTPELFKIGGTPEEMAKLPIEKIEELIASCGLYKSKGKNILATSKMICEKFGGKVPMDMENLTLLSGVGRKSANVVLGNAFNLPGFPVDTHVKRLLNLIGAVKSNSPEVIERETCLKIDEKYWTNFSHVLILHGRKICVANRPKCEICVIEEYCRSSKK